MTGVPLFQIGSQIVAGVSIGRRRIRVRYHFSDWSPWESIKWFPDVFKPLNADARAMLKIARSGK